MSDPAQRTVLAMSPFQARKVWLATPTVYVLLAPEGCELYIGSTCDLWRRLLEHRRRAPWWHEVAGIRWHRCATRQQAALLERACIRDLDPILNVHNARYPKEARKERAAAERRGRL